MSLSAALVSCMIAEDTKLSPATSPPENFTLSTCGRINPLEERSMACTGNHGAAIRSFVGDMVGEV